MNGGLLSIEISCRSGVWFARLNRPERRNALSEDSLSNMLALCARVEQDPQSRALVLWGAGGHFCAGADTSRLLGLLEEPPDEHGDPLTRHNRTFGAVLERLRALPVPTIAVVRGSAVGGGCGLAAACDRVIAADDAVFSMPEVTLGVAPAQIAPFIIERVGKARSRWLLICAEPMNAGRAQELGLADVVVPPADVSAAVSAALHSILKTEPEAVRATRRLIGVWEEHGLAAALDQGSAEFARLVRFGAVRAGLAAARERRSPAWVAGLPELPEFS